MHQKKTAPDFCYQIITIFTPNFKTIIMKKLLLSAALLATTLSASFAQVSLPPFETGNIPGATFIPLFQGMNGSYTPQGISIPKLTGSLNSITITATLTASVDFTYANDFTFLVTEAGSLNPAESRLIQVGGFSNIAANKIDWPCGADCDSDEIGTVVTGTVTFTGLDFAATEYVIWWGNGYAAEGTSGAWNVTELTFGGVNLGNLSIEGNAPVAAVAYPNPASDVLNIAVEGDEVVSVAVIAMDGKVVSNNQGSTAMVADLTAGMYIYEARTASGAVIRNTFVKK
jgi:hypothetical protein